MSAYDDMCVLANSAVVSHVCSTNNSTSTHKKKAFLWKNNIDSARLCLLILLVVSPASAGPVRSRRSASSSSTYSYSSSDNRLPLTEDTPEASFLERKIFEQLHQAALRSSPPILRSLQEQELSPSSKSISSSSSSSTSSNTSSSSRQHPSSSRMTDEGDNVGNNGRYRREAHWSQPCTNLMHDTSNTQQSLSEYILRAVAKAYSYMDSFRDKYSSETLSMDWNTAMENYTKDQHINFLKAITKPNNLDFNTQLKETYEMMQRLAVGIEQVTLDQALYRGTFLEQFRSIENHIVTILCQLHYAMVHQNLTPEVPVTKEIMGEEYRDLEGEAARKMRDTIIVRDYDKSLKHLRYIFTEFQQA